ncbi:MAG TPA: nuclease-related domain-containing protein [Ardenticatenaceae bacterium]|jgi:Holliday junction resolvase-like predicted endonuclease
MAYVDSLRLDGFEAGHHTARTDTAPAETPLSRAIGFYNAGKRRECQAQLRGLLLQDPDVWKALLWLAKSSNDGQERLAAAELACKLTPGKETAQRAVRTVRQETGERLGPITEAAQLRAAINLYTGMTLTEARAVLWPFRDVWRPMGDLLNDNRIGVRDLAWATEYARNARVKAAARTLLWHRLLGKEPVETPRALKVITASRYGEMQERDGIFDAGGIVGAVAMLTGLIVASLIFSFVIGKIGFLALLLAEASALTVACAAMLTLTKRSTDRVFHYRQGRYGEDRAADAFRDTLDGRWTLLRNWEWPNRKWGDVDLILVGLRGVWAFEVKAYKGEIRNRGDHWERKGRWRWHRLSKQPGKQAKRNASRLKEYLEQQGIKCGWVQPVILWASEEGSLTLQDPAVPVWRVHEIQEHIEELWQGRPLSDNAAQEIVKVLERKTGADK